MPTDSDDDRRVRRLIAKAKNTPLTLPEIAAVCPYRTLLAFNRSVTRRTKPTAVIAALGFTPDDLTDRMRADIIAEIKAGGVVMLVSNSPELRDYAKREIGLALSAVGGTG